VQTEGATKVRDTDMRAEEQKLREKALKSALKNKMRAET
jgi:hypothetical protein